MALTLPDVGAFTDANRNAAVAKVAAMDASIAANAATFTGKIDWSAFAPAGGSANGTMISFGGNWITFSTVGAAAIKMLCANSAATGNFASFRVRARSDVATSTQNTNTLAVDAASSANIADYGDLICGSFYAQDNGYAQARANHWSVALRACTQCTGTSAGRRYAMWVSDYSTTNKASIAQYLMRLDKASGVMTCDGIFDIANCDQFTYLFNFTNAGGFLTDTSTKLQVMTPAGAKYIALS